MDSVKLHDTFPIPEGGLQISQITQKTGGPIMQKIKKRLSLLLVLCLLLGIALPAMPMHASAAPVAAPTAANDADWGHMDAVSALQPGQTYFTGNE